MVECGRGETVDGSVVKNTASSSDVVAAPSRVYVGSRSFARSLSFMSPTFAGVSELASAGKDVALGSMLGTSDGPKVGGDDGGSEGVPVGMGEGSSEGISVGGADGSSEGVTVGEVEGCHEGITVGGREGFAVGSKEGVCVGEMEGITVGSTKGASVGEKVDNLHRRTISYPRLKSPT
jgi:hypothetical protein